MENSTAHDLTIIVNTCDAYYDVLDIFFYALQEFWPDCPYPIVINTETRFYTHRASVHHHHSLIGADDWGERLLATLTTIKSEFVIMLYDDFILDAPVSTKRVREALCFLQEQPSSAAAYLIKTSMPLTDNDRASVFVPVKERVDYRLNSAPGIWRKQALMDFTKVGDTPWAWEVFGTYRAWGDPRTIYALNPNQPDIYFYNYEKGGAIYRGKWVREVIDQVKKKYPLNIDWDVRGFSSSTNFEKRSILWKLRFIETGFRMVGFKAFYFLVSYLRKKWYVQ